MPSKGRGCNHEHYFHECIIVEGSGTTTCYPKEEGLAMLRKGIFEFA
jgi:hypothetical protein